MTTTAHRFLLSLPLAVPLMANAFNLGQLTTQSHRGENLDATIALYLAPGESTLPLAVTLAPDLFSPAQFSTATLLGALSSQVEYAAGGYAQIHLRSTTPQNLSELNFRVRAQLGTEALSRVYALKLPPAPRVVRARPATSRAIPELSAASLTATTYGPVRSGDTLWAIARRVRGTAALNATMQALHVANPHAFVNGDINRLKLGVTLALPTDAARKSVRTEAPRAASTALRNTETEDFFATEDTAAPSAAKTRAATTATLAQRDPVLAKKLAELDLKYAAIRAQYAAPATSAPATTTAPVVVTAAPVATPDLAPVAPLSAAAPAVPRDVAAATPKASSGGGSLLLLSILFGTVLAGAVFAYSRHRLQARRNLQAAFETREARRKAEVSAKAGRGEEQVPAPASAVVSEVFVAPDLAATLDGMDIARTITPLFAPLEDSQDDIDASIAHGRYEDAEHLLQKVILAAPRNVAAKLRLAEVFYITERVEDFSTLAEDLQLNHRADLTNDEWRRVMRMGKVIAPELALFAGPRAVSAG